MSAGLPLPESVFAHGFMLMRGERMSKTARQHPRSRGRGRAVRGRRRALRGPARDSVRPRRRRRPPTASCAATTPSSPTTWATCVNRTVSMSARYLDRALPPVAGADAPADQELQRAAASAVETYHAAMGRLHLDEALGAVMDLTSAANGYAESQAPWARNKEGDEARVGAILAAMAETCRILGHLMAPFTPAAAAELHAQLGVPVPYDDRGAGGPGLDRLLAWGSGPAGWQTGDAQPLFPRVELPDETPRVPEPSPRAGAPGRPGRLALPPPGPRLRRRPRGGHRAGRGGGDRAHPGARLRPRLVAGGGRAGGRASGADRRGGGRASALLGRPTAAEWDELAAPRRRAGGRGGGGDRARLPPGPVAARGPARRARAAAGDRRGASASRCWSTTARRTTRCARRCCAWDGTRRERPARHAALLLGRRGAGAAISPRAATSSASPCRSASRRRSRPARGAAAAFPRAPTWSRPTRPGWRRAAGSSATSRPRHCAWLPSWRGCAARSPEAIAAHRDRGPTLVVDPPRRGAARFLTARRLQRPRRATIR